MNILIAEDDPISRKLLQKNIESLGHVVFAAENGGEEILVFLPDQDEQSTLLAAERICKMVESLAIEHQGSEKGIITISCGVAAFNNECGDIKWAATVERADQAKYRAKSAGRNKVSA